MGVELTHHIANDAGTFIESTVGAITAVVHSIDHATMYRFKTVAYIGQGATDNNCHRVIQIRTLHFGLQVDLLNITVGIIDQNLTAVSGDLDIDIWVFALVFFTHSCSVPL